ncbi:head maturation protease [Propionibacterium phage Anatole]|uniref:Capsid maturation protease n=2 Tax=Anatolevirus anatole TaxID=2169704 RepID=A0A1D8ET51_9CAUD|nr:head maturation protease [Propionibacterium phage Anatole]AOT24244.1 capsid maturation protease [Propionibacterium phage Anatole]AOT24479.1 capsid maturation protease [Propionibacterium phage E1]
MRHKIKSTETRIKAGPDAGLKDGEFTAYPSTFTRQPDSYGDVVAKGAFADTIKAWKDSGRTMPGLFGHRMDDPELFVASATDMGEDDHGWWVKGIFDLDNPKAVQVYRLVKSGRLSQLSFAFDVDDEATVELDDGTKANELRKLKVFEFSFVPIGANQDTSIVAVKAPGDDQSSDDGDAALSDEAEAVLSEVLDVLTNSVEKIKNLLAPSGSGSDDVQASGQADANDEEPSSAPAKSKEHGVSPSAQTLSLQIDIAALSGQEGDSR